MTPSRVRAVLFSVLATACLAEEDVVARCPPDGCRDPASTSASFLTLRRTSPPDEDPATWTFALDELVCTLYPPGATGQIPPPSCSIADQPDDGTVPLFVTAEIKTTGFGRLFRIDTMGRATSHIRIERNGILVDELDHSPTFVPAICPQFKYDAGGELNLPP